MASWSSWTGSGAPAPGRGTLRGVTLAIASTLLFGAQDALVKWLVADYAVFQILFVRSAMVLAVVAAVGGRGAATAVLASGNKRALVSRAALVLASWLTYYAAAKRLGLAELTTLYFVAPVIIVLLSVVVLHERVSAARWIVVLVGFAGVAVAARPGGTVPVGPALATLLAAAGWALGTVLIRTISRVETTTTQVLVSNAVFALACGLGLMWTWRTPTAFDLALMAGVGATGGGAQYLLYEAYRLAPASVIAPTEYTGFVWAFVFAFAIWAEVPSAQVWVGAAMILGSGLALVMVERRHPSPTGDGRAEAA